MKNSRSGNMVRKRSMKPPAARIFKSTPRELLLLIGPPLAAPGHVGDPAREILVESMVFRDEPFISQKDFGHAPRRGGESFRDDARR